MIEGVRQPDYDRAGLEPGILHIGLGAFHRAHQAVYTDTALGHEFGPWGIESVSLRSLDTVDALDAQSGLFSVLVRESAGTNARVIGSIVKARAARTDPEAVLERLADPDIRIVTLTVTEKAYGIDPDTGGLDRDHPDVAHDLATPSHPRGVIGHIVEGLARRRKRGLPAFTVLCCDNLPGNGRIVERLTREFAGERDSQLASWIGDTVAFPSSMVDRIVPAPTQATLRDAQTLLGCSDAVAVETEPFMQWVIEDRFPTGRPAWEAAGALFVADVEPYERMKLRLLNGAHSLIAYLGQNRGIDYVRDVVRMPAYRALVEAYMREAALTLAPVPGIDLDNYIASLIARFSNRAIAHSTRQIAMDGTQKLPQRIVQPAAEAVLAGRDGGTYARAVAEWIVFCCRADEIDDPRKNDLNSAARQAKAAGRTPAPEPFVFLEGLFPDRLRDNDAWREILRRNLELVWSESGGE